MTGTTTLQPKPDGEVFKYDEVPAHVPARNNNFTRVMDGVGETVNGVSEMVAGCIGLSYDAFDSIGDMLNALSAAYGKITGADRPTHIPAIHNLGLPPAAQPDAQK